MKYICLVCGAILDQQYENCPVCGAPKDKIVPYNDATSEVSLDSTATNNQSAPEKTVTDAPQQTFTSNKLLKFVDAHTIGAAKFASPEIREKLQQCFKAETWEVGVYFAMARQAYREGYPEVGQLMERVALDEAYHASRFAELIGEGVTTSTKDNLKKVIHGEVGANILRKEIADLSKVQNQDMIHDFVHEACRDEARHGMSFNAMLKRYFNENLIDE